MTALRFIEIDGNPQALPANTGAALRSTALVGVAVTTDGAMSTRACPAHAVTER